MSRYPSQLQECIDISRSCTKLRNGSQFFDFDQTPSVGSYPFLPSTIPILSIIASIINDNPMKCNKGNQEVDIIYQEKTLRGLFKFFFDYHNNYHLSFSFPHTRVGKCEQGGILTMIFIIQKISSVFKVINSEVLGLDVKRIRCLDEYRNEGWSTLPHAGTFLMRMCEKLFRHLQIKKVNLTDMSSLGKIPYTPLRFFQGKGSWYENFGYQYYQCRQRENARELLRTTPILTFSKDLILLEPPADPNETIFDYLARFALSDIERFDKIFQHLLSVDTTKILRHSFNLSTSMTVKYEDI